MKDLTPKFDNTAGPTGEYTAAEFNDLHDDAQTAVTESGQTLTVAEGDNNRQLSMAIATGGKRTSRADAETALIGENVQPDNSSAALTINQPSGTPFDGATIFYEQVTDQLYSVNALTIGRNGNNIEGSATDFILNSTNADNTKIATVWVGGSIGWKVLVVGAVGVTL